MRHLGRHGLRAHLHLGIDVGVGCGRMLRSLWTDGCSTVGSPGISLWVSLRITLRISLGTGLWSGLWTGVGHGCADCLLCRSEGRARGRRCRRPGGGGVARQAVEGVGIVGAERRHGLAALCRETRSI